MSAEIDWEKAKNTWRSTAKRPGWPEGVNAISLEGLSFLGVHEKTGHLYWDGQKLVIENVFSLGKFERVLAGFAAAGTFGVFVLELGRTLGIWL